jgi:hypothetical protein
LFGVVRFQSEAGLPVLDGQLLGLARNTPDTTEVYFLRPDRGKGKKFSGEEYLMTYDARNRLVSFHYLGID